MDVDLTFAIIDLSDARVRHLRHDRDGVRLALTLWDGSERALRFTDAVSWDGMEWFGNDLSHVASIAAPWHLLLLAEESGVNLVRHRCFAVRLAGTDTAMFRIIAADCALE